MGKVIPEDVLKQFVDMVIEATRKKTFLLQGKLVSLHKYFMASEELRIYIKDHESSYLTTVWLALIFVVAEGYKDKLKLSVDDDINILLANNHYHTLRRIRNATFHYEDDIATNKIFNKQTVSCITWAAKVVAAFKIFFDKYCPELKTISLGRWLSHFSNILSGSDKIIIETAAKKAASHILGIETDKLDMNILITAEQSQKAIAHTVHLLAGDGAPLEKLNKLKPLISSLSSISDNIHKNIGLKENEG